MEFFIFVLLVCLFVFLYCVYLLSNDDFIFLRRDLTMERLFNIIFLGSLSSLFFARIFYGIFHAKDVLANPFVFILFPYFPGLSLLGGLVGGGVVFLFLGVRQKNRLPLGRLADFFSISFLITLPIGFLGYFMLTLDTFSAIEAGSIVVTYLILFIIFLKFLLPLLMSGKIKEGTIAFLFLICFSMISLFTNVIGNLKEIFSLENIILSFMLVVSIVVLIREEKLLSKFKISR